MKKFIAAAVVVVSLGSFAGAQEADTKIADRISADHAVLHELMDTPDKGVPLDIAASATCVAVVPAFKKGAFVVGGQYGQGVATCRTPHGWSAPVFIQLEGASFGFQIGGQSTDLVLIGRSHRSLDDLLKDKVKLGGDAAVAAGHLPYLAGAAWSLAGTTLRLVGSGAQQLNGDLTSTGAPLRVVLAISAILATVTSGDAMSATQEGLAANGTLLVIGAVPELKVNSINLLMGCRSVKGWYSGTSIDSQDTLTFSAQSGVRSMNEIYPLDRVSEGYDRMMSCKARFRVVLTMGG